MYIRDKRSPRPKSEKVSKVMSSNKAKNTDPELAMRKALCEVGIRNYRLHGKKVIGRPDVYFSKQKLAIFVHGCFWHHCPQCNLPLPKHNRAFWKAKFERNQERDKKKINDLKKEGWKCLVVWEHELKQSPGRVALKVVRTLEVSNQSS